VRSLLFDPLTREQVDQLRDICEAIAGGAPPPPRVD
jgi:hypothetical protein